MRALVIGGGGSKGAWAGGVIEYLVKKKHYKWSAVIGASTGSLLAPLSALGEVERLKQAYTNVTNSTVFSVKPFKENGKLRVFNAAKRVLTGKTSLGVAGELWNNLHKIISIDDYNRLREENKQVIATVTNMSLCRTEYQSVLDNTFDDFNEWLVASASVPLLFEVVNKCGYEYLDGGVLEPVPIQKAIDLGATEVDVIILSANDYRVYPKMDNMFNVVMRTIDFMNKEITKDDIVIGKLYGSADEVKINIYRTPESLTKNAILFKKEEMQIWWKMGYEYGAQHHEVTEVKLKRTKSSAEYKVKSLIKNGELVKKIRKKQS